MTASYCHVCMESYCVRNICSYLWLVMSAGAATGKAHLEYDSVLSSRKALQLSHSLLLDRPVYVSLTASSFIILSSRQGTAAVTHPLLLDRLVYMSFTSPIIVVCEIPRD